MSPSHGGHTKLKAFIKMTLFVHQRQTIFLKNKNRFK